MPVFFIVILALLLGSCSTGSEAPMPSPQSTPQSSTQDLKKRLTPEQWKVTQECGTEPAFHNAFWDNHKPGIYVDVIDGTPLFASTDKFDSGSGWPSFVKAIDPVSVQAKTDSSHGMERVEVRSKKANSHLGHLFPDGPKERGGLRFCINSASLRFIPAENLAAEGYSIYRPLFEPALTKTECAILGGGCFWGVQSIIQQQKGIIDTVAGYAGGTAHHPTYEAVCTGKTNHAEVVLVFYNPEEITYETVLDLFWRLHDPTTKNRQGPDIGTQYRSIIFTTSATQARLAEVSKTALDTTKTFPKPATTTIEPLTLFWPAEAYHQNWFRNKGGGSGCHILRP